MGVKLGLMAIQVGKEIGWDGKSKVATPTWLSSKQVAHIGFCLGEILMYLYISIVNLWGRAWPEFYVGLKIQAQTSLNQIGISCSPSRLKFGQGLFV